MFTSRRSLSLVVVLGMVVTACTSAATPVPTPPATAAPSVAPTATPTPDGTLPKPELTSVKLGTPIGQFSQFDTVLASQLQLYQKYGVNVTITKFNAGGDAVQAVLSGAVDVGASAGVEIAITTQTTETPVTALSVQKRGVYEGLFCAPNIKTAADVKGKQVGISTFGSAGHASALLDLQALGLTPNDVQIVQIGGSSTRAAALKSGALACGPLDIGLKSEFLGLGFNLLVDLSARPDLQWPAIGLAAPAAWLQKYPNTALALLAAELEATSVMLHDKTTTAKQWAAFLQTDEAKAATLYDASINQINPDLTWSKSSFDFAKSVIATVTPSVASVDVTKAYDPSYLRKLNDLGFYKKVGLNYPTANWP